MNGLRWIVLVLGFLLQSCATSVYVESEPAGAMIYVNGNGTGSRTPAKLTKSDLVRFGGKSPFKVEVQLDGQAKSPPQFVNTTVAVGRIIWAVALPLPMLIVNSFRGFNRLEPGRLRFELRADR